VISVIIHLKIPTELLMYSNCTIAQRQADYY